MGHKPSERINRMTRDEIEQQWPGFQTWLKANKRYLAIDNKSMVIFWEEWKGIRNEN